MQLLLIVLNKVELLDPLLKRLLDEELCGGTILSSTGMLRELARSTEDLPLFGALRLHLNPNRKESKTILLALDETKTERAKEIVRDVIGDLSKPDTAVMFTLPILSAEGVEF
ncbi:MAG: hypothetical protein WDA00_07495 [Eubacteriales bacterium]